MERRTYLQPSIVEDSIHQSLLVISKGIAVVVAATCTETEHLKPPRRESPGEDIVRTSNFSMPKPTSAPNSNAVVEKRNGDTYFAFMCHTR